MLLHYLLILTLISQVNSYQSTKLAASTSSINNNPIDDIITSRYACTRFKPYSSTNGDYTPNPDILSQSIHCLDIARRAPSGFNAQPYRAIIVSSPGSKKALSKYCLGPNQFRVLDSDCTILFLADLECGRNWKWWWDQPCSSNLKKKRERIFFTMLFSSGFPIPRLLRAPVSFFIRFLFSIISVLSRRRILLPSLTNAETWSVKNTMLFAMTYILACTSYDIATCPMEGVNVGGIKRAFKIPNRFSIPLIVSTGTPLEKKPKIEDSKDYMGVSHGHGKNMTPRFPFQNIIFADSYNQSCQEPANI